MQKIFLSGLLLCFAGMMACNEPDTIGLDVLPGSDSLSIDFFDTLSIETVVSNDDTVVSDVSTAVLDYFMIGQYQDPIFGSSTASLYTQVLPSAAAPDLSDCVFDSVFLNLSYVSFYGDSTVSQVYEVYEMSEGMTLDSTYYSNKNFSILPSIVGTSQPFLVNDINDSIYVDSLTNAPPALRIKLDNAFGQRIFSNATTYLTGAAGDFTNNVKGLYIKSAIPNASIITYRTSTSASRMTMYYTKAGKTTADSIPFYFSDQAEHVNHFDHDYSSANFNSIAGQYIYIQGMAGKKAKITFPALTNLNALGPIAINKAELIFYVEPGSETNYAACSSLYLLSFKEDGKLERTPDETRLGTVYGGTLTNGTYRFNIAQYVQQILYNKRTDYGLSLLASRPSQYPNRTIIAGPSYNGSPVYKTKLQITYTKLNQ